MAEAQGPDSSIRARTVRLSHHKPCNVCQWMSYSQQHQIRSFPGRSSLCEQGTKEQCCSRAAQQQRVEQQ